MIGQMLKRNIYKKIDFGRVVKGGGGGGGRERLLPLWKFRESRVRVEESRSRRVPTDFFSLSLLSFFSFYQLFSPSPRSSSISLRGKSKGGPNSTKGAQGPKKKKRKWKRKKEEEEEVDKNHATSPRLLTPAGVSSLFSLSFVTWPRFFFYLPLSHLPPSPPSPRRMVFRVCVCVSVAPLCGGCWKRKKTAFGLFAFGTFSSSSLPFYSEFSSRFASFLPSFVCLPPVL